VPHGIDRRACTAALALAAALGAAGEPRVECAAAEHDFGVVEEGVLAAHTFRLSASGGAVVTGVRSTCGCIAVRVEVERPDGSRVPYEIGTPLAPDAATLVEAELDTLGRRLTASGKIVVASNDPRGALVLSLSATIEPYFRVSPDTVAFGELAEGERATRTFEVAARKPGAFTLSADRSLPPGMQVALSPIEPGADGRANRWKVEVALGPGARDGGLAYPLSLRSDVPIVVAPRGADGRPATYAATAMVTATIRGPISFEPAYLAFGLVHPGASAERVLAVRSDDASFTFPAEPRVRLAHARGDESELAFADCFACSVVRADDGKSLTVSLRVERLPEAALGPFQGRLVLATGHPRRPEIVVTFAGVCR
jgi:hypothetical protein